MRTNIVIDDRLMSRAMRATGLNTKREVVEAGLKMLIQVKSQVGIRRLRGKVKWDGNLEKTRTGSLKIRNHRYNFLPQSTERSKLFKANKYLGGRTQNGKTPDSVER